MFRRSAFAVPRAAGPRHHGHRGWCGRQCCIGRLVRLTERADENGQLSDGHGELVECCMESGGERGRRWRVRSGRGRDFA